MSTIWMYSYVYKVRLLPGFFSLEFPSQLSIAQVVARCDSAVCDALRASFGLVSNWRHIPLVAHILPSRTVWQSGPTENQIRSASSCFSWSANSVLWSGRSNKIAFTFWVWILSSFKHVSFGSLIFARVSIMNSRLGSASHLYFCEVREGASATPLDCRALRARRASRAPPRDPTAFAAVAESCRPEEASWCERSLGTEDTACVCSKEQLRCCCLLIHGKSLHARSVCELR